jgi:hypothetical protein
MKAESRREQTEQTTAAVTIQCGVRSRQARKEVSRRREGKREQPEVQQTGQTTTNTTSTIATTATTTTTTTTTITTATTTTTTTTTSTSTSTTVDPKHSDNINITPPKASSLSTATPLYLQEGGQGTAKAALEQTIVGLQAGTETL